MWPLAWRVDSNSGGEKSHICMILVTQAIWVEYRSVSLPAPQCHQTTLEGNALQPWLIKPIPSWSAFREPCIECVWPTENNNIHWTIWMNWNLIVEWMGGRENRMLFFSCLNVCVCVCLCVNKRDREREREREREGKREYVRVCLRTAEPFFYCIDEKHMNWYAYAVDVYIYNSIWLHCTITGSGGLIIITHFNELATDRATGVLRLITCQRGCKQRHQMVCWDRNVWQHGTRNQLADGLQTTYFINPKWIRDLVGPDAMT